MSVRRCLALAGTIAALTGFLLLFAPGTASAFVQSCGTPTYQAGAPAKGKDCDESKVTKAAVVGLGGAAVGTALAAGGQAVAAARTVEAEAEELADEEAEAEAIATEKGSAEALSEEQAEAETIAEKEAAAESAWPQASEPATLAQQWDTVAGLLAGAGRNLELAESSVRNARDTVTQWREDAQEQLAAAKALPAGDPNAQELTRAAKDRLALADKLETHLNAGDRALDASRDSLAKANATTKTALGDAGATQSTKDAIGRVRATAKKIADQAATVQQGTQHLTSLPLRPAVAVQTKSLAAMGRALALPATDHAGIARTAHEAALHAHGTATRITNAAADARANGTLSPELARAAAEAPALATRMTDGVGRLGRVESVRSVTKIRQELVDIAAEIDQLNAATGLPTTQGDWLTPTGDPAKAKHAQTLNPLAAEESMALGNVAGESMRLAAAAQDPKGFFQGAAARHAGVPRAEAFGAPARAVLPGAAALGKAIRIGEPVPAGEQFVIPEDKLAPDQMYLVTHKGLGGTTYFATYRTNAAKEIAEIWTLSGKGIGPGKGGRIRANPELNNPRPNTIYHVDGRYTYVTDQFGRTVLATGMPAYIGSKQGKRYPGPQRGVGKAGKAEFAAQQGKPQYAGITFAFDGAHLFATMFDGPGELINVLPGLSSLNRMSGGNFLANWAAFEKELKAHLTVYGSSLSVSIELPYENALDGRDFLRTPSGFIVRFWSDEMRGEPTAYPNLPRTPGGGYLDPGS